MRTPIHLWFIGVLSLLWNAGGAYDYVAAKLKIGPYAGDLPPDIASFFASLPAWYTAAWAIGVWFSVLGSLLLLLRSRFAVQAFFISLLGLLASSVYTYGLAEVRMVDSASTLALVFSIAIYVVLVLLLIYARAMRRRGVLR